jgi:hypothetical protein
VSIARVSILGLDPGLRLLLVTIDIVSSILGLRVVIFCCLGLVNSLLVVLSYLEWGMVSSLTPVLLVELRLLSILSLLSLVRVLWLRFLVWVCLSCVVAGWLGFSCTCFASFYIFFFFLVSWNWGLICEFLVWVCLSCVVAGWLGLSSLILSRLIFLTFIKRFLCLDLIRGLFLYLCIFVSLYLCLFVSLLLFFSYLLSLVFSLLI